MKKYELQTIKIKGGLEISKSSTEFDTVPEARIKYFDQVKTCQGLIKNGLDCDKIIITVTKKTKPNEYIEYEEI